MYRPSQYYNNSRSANEKYFKGTSISANTAVTASDWYFIVPNGDLYNFINGTGTGNTFLSDNIKLTTLSSSYYNNPNLIHDAIKPTTSDTCNSNEEIIASLQQFSNSQVSEGNDPNYPIKICCNANQNIISVHWGDPQNNIINSSNLNDLVNLVVNGDGLQNKIINYTIYKNVILGADSIVAKISRSNSTSWRAGKNDNGNLENGDFYFKALIEGDPIIKSTKDNPNPDFRFLKVTGPESNTPPTAEITSPENKQVYFLGETLNFTQNSFDTDDGFNYTWDLGDGTILEGNSTSLINYNFTHSYNGLNNLGQKNIILTVTDNRGLTARDQISILIINSTYVLSFIDRPQFGQNYGRIVDYDATSSYAVSSTQIDACAKTITCETGNCPAQTAGCPPCYAANGLSCPITIINAPTSPSLANYDNMEFCWEFDNGLSGSFCSSGSAGVSFPKVYGFIGRHTTSLTINVNPSSTLTTEFDVFYDKPTCIVVTDANQNKFPGLQPGKSYWKESGTIPSESKSSCYRADGIDTNGDARNFCCRFGETCNDISGNFECVVELKNKCKDFITETNCESNDGNRVIAVGELNSILKTQFTDGCEFNQIYGNKCIEFLTCQCDWNSTISECQATSNHKLSEITLITPLIWDFNNLPSNITTICVASSTSEPTKGKCVFDFTYQGDCSAGDEFILRSWTTEYQTTAASANIPTYCSDGSDVVSCSNIIKLPIFSPTNIIITILFLIIIYYFISRKKKK